jgi:hypothetical protein
VHYLNADAKDKIDFRAYVAQIRDFLLGNFMSSLRLLRRLHSKIASTKVKEEEKRRSKEEKSERGVSDAMQPIVSGALPRCI